MRETEIRIEQSWRLLVQKDQKNRKRVRGLSNDDEIEMYECRGDGEKLLAQSLGENQKERAKGRINERIDE